jgi:hypothetical protein
MKNTARAGIAAACGFMLCPSVVCASQTDPIQGHSCEETVSGSFGNARVFAILRPDGAISHYLLVWEMQPRREGVWLSGTWALGSGPGEPGDNGEISVHFATGDNDVGEVRIEMWRGGEYPLARMGFRGEYMRVYRTQSGAPFATQSQARWGDIRAILSGIEAATVGVVTYRMAWVRAEDRLDASIINLPAAAVAAARDGLATRVADYHNRCRPMRASDGIP